MNILYKLKTRQSKQQSINRRIKTQTNQNNIKKQKYTIITQQTKPLQQNKKIFNQSSDHNQSNNFYCPIQKSKPIKTIYTKNNQSSKLVTENYQKNYIYNPIQQANIKEIFKIPAKENLSKTLSNNNEYAKKKIIMKDKEKSIKQDKKENNILIERKDNYTNQQLIKFSQKEKKLQGINRYAFQDKVGAGTFGIVHKARDKKTLELVAIKKVYQDKKYKNRQLEILKMLNHPNVLKMKDCFYTYQNDKQYLNVVMDYYQSNLYESIQKYRGRSQIPRLKLKVYAYQLFRSLLYLNKINIAHRDIKPQNILVNDSNWNLIMCDFGSAKQLKFGETNISYICSRCYRAPQLIFGNTAYTTQIDMWSVGCVLVQMITMQPLFRSESNIDQLVEIIKVLGTPSINEMLQMNQQCEIEKYQLPKINAKSWQKVVKRKNLGNQFFDLVKKVLIYSPIKRLTPYEALIHPFFDQIKKQQVYQSLKKQYNIPNLFNFNLTKQVDEYKIRTLIPKWYKV